MSHGLKSFCSFTKLCKWLSYHLITFFIRTFIQPHTITLLVYLYNNSLVCLVPPCTLTISIICCNVTQCCYLHSYSTAHAGNDTVDTVSLASQNFHHCQLADCLHHPIKGAPINPITPLAEIIKNTHWNQGWIGLNI